MHKLKNTRLPSFNLNDKVQWKWMGRFIEGTVEEIFFESVIRIIKQKPIKRNGTQENPAYFVKSTAGNFALKLQSELFAIVEDNQKIKKPKMFR
jgi:hypothetical protein